MSFDPTAFLNQTFEGANDTKRVPCPASEYPAIVKKYDVLPWTSKDQTKSGLKLQITWDIQDDNVKQLLDRDEVTCRQDIMLDLTDAGGLDMGKGKNLGLGRLREALDLNGAGPFSFPMIEGRMAKVNVNHRVVGEDIYDEVNRVARL